MDKNNFVAFFEDEDNKNKWWTPALQMTSEIRAPFLLALPNAMVEILRESGGVSTPADVLAAMEEVRLRMDRGVPEDQWKTIIEWCLVASLLFTYVRYVDPRSLSLQTRLPHYLKLDYLVTRASSGHT